MAAIASIVVLVILALSAGMLHVPIVQDFVKSKGEDYLLENQGIDVDAEDLDFSLFGLKSTLTNVTIRSDDATGEPPFFQADRVFIDLSTTALLRGRLDVEKAQIDGGRISYIIDENGDSNVPSSDSSGEESTSDPNGPLPFLIRDFKATGPAIQYEDRQNQRILELPNWTFTIRGEPSPQTHRVDFRMDATGRLAMEDRELPLDEFKAGLTLRQGRAEIRELSLRSGEAFIEAAGDVTDFGTPTGEISTTIKADIAPLLELAGQDIALGGELELALGISGDLLSPRIEADVRMEDLSYEQFQDMVLTADAAWEAAGERVDVDAFRLDAPFGALQGSSSLALSESAGQSRAQVQLERVDLARLSRSYDPPMTPAARATGSVQATWPGLDFDAAEGEAKLQLSATRQEPAEDVLPLSGALDARLAGNRLTARLSQIKALGVTTSGNVAVTDFSGLGGSIEIDIADLEQTVARADALLGSEDGESVAPTELAGALRASIDLSGSVEQPRAAIQAASDSLTAGKLENIAFRFDGAYNTDEAVIDALELTWRNERIDVSGRVGLAGESPELALEARADTVALADVMAALGREEPVTGDLTIIADINGTVADPQGLAQISITDLNAFQEAFGQLNLTATLADGVATIEQLQLDKPNGGTLQATGSYRLEDGFYSVEASTRDLALEGLTLPSGEVLRGAVNLTAAGRGTADDPTLSATLNARDFEYGETLLGDLGLGLEVADGRADLTASAPRFAASIEAEAGLDSPQPADIRLAIDGFDLSTLQIQGRDGKPLEGRIAGVITAQGDIENPEGFTVQTDFSEVRLESGGVVVRNEGPLRATYRERQVAVERAELISGRSSLTIDGSLPLTEADGDGELTIGGALNLEVVPALMGMTLEEAFVLGILNIDGTIGGSLESIRPNLNALLEDGVILTPATIQPITAIQMQITADQQRVELSRFSAEFSRGKIEASGGIPMELIAESGLPFEVFEKKRPAVLDATIDGLNLDELGVVPDGGGRVGGRLQVEAAELTAEAVTAELELNQLTLNVRDLNLQQAQPVRLSFKEGLLEIASFEITGPETRIEASGDAKLAEGGALDLALEAKADAGVIGYLVEDLRMSGPVTANFTVGGTMEEPDVEGRFELSDGALALETPRFDADQIQVALTMQGERVEIETLTAAMNGGRFQAEGGLSLADDISDVDVKLTAQEVYMDFPEGLQTVSNADLRFHDADDNLLRLDGSVVVQDGSFRDRVDIGSDVLAMLGGGGGLDFAEEPDPLLSRIRYGVKVDTDNPILVDNNLARMEASFDLRVVGSYYRPSLLGRVVLEEGGEVYLAENEYIIETGVIDFTNETRIRPSLNLRARTQVAGHDITLLATGDGEDLETQFTSDSGLSEPDIISLLLTGRTLEEAQESGLNIASQQALSYLTGSLGGRLGKAAEESLGLSRVRVEPNLISAEGDPSARLTIGQDITRKLNLIYSMNLTDSGDQIFVTEYDITKRFNARGVKQSDNTYRFDFRHDIRWGLEAEDDRKRREGPKIRVASLEFEGDAKLTEEELRDRVGLEVGDRYDFFKARKKTDKLKKSYQQDDRLEARVRLRREERKEQQEVDLLFKIEAGPQINFAYSPVEPPSGVQKRVREAWGLGVFEAQRVDDATEVLERWLFADGYLEAEIESQVEIPAPDQRTIRFVIRPGVSYNDVELVFQGNEGLTDEMLELALVRTELRKSIKSDPRDVVDTIASYYRQEGWLDAEVQRPEFELEPDTGFGRVIIAINEGPQYKIGALTFNGADAVDEATLRAEVTPEEGRAYTPLYLEDSIQNVEEVYWAKGYNDVLVNFTLTRRREDAKVDITFELTENKQDVVKEIAVEGNEEVNAKLIRKRLATKEGDLLISEDNDKSRRRLYETSAFALVDLQTQPLDDALAPAGQNPLRLLAKVREVSPFRVRYGSFFDTDRGPGVIVDFENRNTLGAARSLGFRGRYDNDFREARAYFSQPLLLNQPIETTSAMFRSRELRDTFVTDRTGVSVQQELELGRRSIFTYGYRFERTHTFDRDEDAFIPLDLKFNLAPLTSTFTFDSRDEILDATRGQFFSHGVEFAPSQFGSDVQYWKYFGQYFRYFPFFRPTPTPFDKEVKRPKLVYATGVRMGLANGLGGQSIVPSERFFAGGGTTIRGFAQDAAGPTDFFGDPEGGEAVFVLNNEARFPVVSIFEGVGFLDVGNVYREFTDFDPTSLRTTAGVGLRVRTPFFLLRLDYGWKLDRKPDEKAGAFFFSIGQAF